MELLKQLNIKSAILKLKVLDNNKLAIIDAHNTLRIVELEKYKVVSGFKSNIIHERTFGDHVDIDESARLSASIIPSKAKAALFSVPKKKIFYQISRHKGDVESVAISPDLNYFVTAGTDGKTFAWTLKTARLAFSMFPHADYVTALAFSKNSLWLASGSFDKTIHVLNLATMHATPIMHGHASVVRKIIFFDNIKLVSAEKNGTVIVWDRKKGTLLERLKKLSDEITTMCMSDDERFLFVATKLGYIALYDLTTYEQLTHKYIKESAMITSLAFIHEGFKLAVGLEDGIVKFYSLFGDETLYNDMIHKENYEAFFKAYTKNPLLRYSKAYEAMQKQWEKAYESAKKLLSKRKKEEAKKLLTPFQKIQDYTRIVQSILRDYEKFDQFVNYLKMKKYALAYSLVTQYPIYKESQEYQEVEKEWKLLFNKAKEYILKKDGDEIAKKLLEPFRGISQKTQLIKELFDDRKMYLYLRELLGKKEYKKAFILIARHPFLKEFPEYDMLEQFGDDLYIKAYQAYSTNDFIKAEKLSKILIAFPDYEEDAKDMLESIRTHNIFLQAVEENNMDKAFEYLDKFPLLYDTSLGKKLINEWNQLIEKARVIASKGDVSGLKELLYDYLNVTTQKEAIATLFKQAYMKQLDAAIKNSVDKNSINKAIRRYVATFGLDDYIELVTESYNSKYKDNLNLEELVQGSIKTWIPEHAFDTIVE